MAKSQSLVQQHPAESTTAVAGAIVVVLGLLGVTVDPTTLVVILAGIAALPALITGIVKQIRGK